MAAGMVMFAVGGLFAGTGQTCIIWPLLGYCCTGIGFLWYWPVTLAFVSRRAPGSITSLTIGSTYVTLFVASLLTGYIGSLYQTLPAAQFFLLNAALPASGAVLLFLFGRHLTRTLDAASDEHTKHPLISSQESTT